MDKRNIYKEILKLEAGVHRKGFELVVAGIEKICNNPCIRTITLYDELAKEFNDTRTRVERAIRYYIECIFNEGNKEEIKKFKMKIGVRGVPNCTEFLRAVAVWFKMNY